LPGKPDVGRSLMEMLGGRYSHATAVPTPQFLVQDLLHLHDRFGVAQSRQDSHHLGDVLLSLVLLMDPDWVHAEQDLEHVIVQSAIRDLELLVFCLAPLGFVHIGANAASV
jgi:hypothetical protein